MKFEKISQDKIKVTINREDLAKNEMDFRSLISDSEESQSFFLDVLEIAEKDYGFSTRDYSLKVETAALEDSFLILTITRISDYPLEGKRAPTARRKKPVLDTSIVYQFGCFDDFCYFIDCLSHTLSSEMLLLAKDTSLYQYQDRYYLILRNVNPKVPALKKAISIITEFATYVSSSEIRIAKILEIGKPIFSKKALEQCQKFFIS